VPSNTTAPTPITWQRRSERVCKMGPHTERPSLEPVQATTPASQPSIFQANPLSNTQASFQQRAVQGGNSPMVAFQPFTFQSESQTKPSSPSTQQFTFEIGPTSPTPVLFSTFTSPNTSTQSTSNLQANPPLNTQVSSQEYPAQGVSPAATSQPFTFQTNPTPLLAPAPQPFTFQAGPVYPRPVLSSDLSLIKPHTRSDSTDSASESDVDGLHRLEREVEALQNQYSDLQRETAFLKEQNVQDRARASQPPPDQSPSPPTIDPKAELRRLWRSQEHQAAVAEQAHKDAKRVEVEVKRQARHGDIEDKRRDWWDKNNNRNVSPLRHPFPVSPATVAAPRTSFTTTLAYQPAPGPPRRNQWRLTAQPIPQQPFPPSGIPIASQSRPCSRSPEWKATKRPACWRDKPAPKGILCKPARDNDRPNPLKFVRFDPVLNFREDSGDEAEDVATTDAAREAEWPDNVMKDLNHSDG
jgi:hypothetical protein